MATPSSQPETSSALKFGVKVVDSKTGMSQPAEIPTIEFQCPGCGKAFQESAQAAGKRTRCPKCNTEFVIAAETPPAPPTAKEAEQSVDEKVAAALAAYDAAKNSPTQRRWITPTTIVPIGFFLLTLGAVASVAGSYFMVQGYLSAFSGIMGGGGILGGGNAAAKPVADYAKLLNELAAEPGARQPAANPADNPLANLPLNAGQDAKKSLAERKAKQESGQAKLIGGVIASGIGMFVTFVGGIFLLAGLIGRFVQPSEKLRVER